VRHGGQAGRDVLNSHPTPILMTKQATADSGRLLCLFEYCCCCYPRWCCYRCCRRRSTAEVLALLHRLAPGAVIEKASIDEVYIDVTAMVEREVQVGGRVGGCLLV
jgi:hypothetical protein